LEVVTESALSEESEVAAEFNDTELLLISAGFVTAILCCGGVLLFFFWRRRAEKLRNLTQSQMDRVKAKRKARASIGGSLLINGGEAPENLPSAPLMDGHAGADEDMDHWLEMRLGIVKVGADDLHRGKDYAAEAIAEQDKIDDAPEDLPRAPVASSSEILAAARARHASIAIQRTSQPPPPSEPAPRLSSYTADEVATWSIADGDDYYEDNYKASSSSDGVQYRV
jgi:hypothetical protein